MTKALTRAGCFADVLYGEREADVPTIIGNEVYEGQISRQVRLPLSGDTVIILQLALWRCCYQSCSPIRNGNVRSKRIGPRSCQQFR